MRVEGPNHYPYILEMALNQYRIDTVDHYLYYITKPLFKNINCYNFNCVSRTRRGMFFSKSTR